MEKESKITKDWLISRVNDINKIIEDTNYENVYDQVVKFFNAISVIHDHFPLIEKLDKKGWRFLWIKSKSRKQAERNFLDFKLKVFNARRNLDGNNRTLPGEIVTDEDVFFGGINGWKMYSINRIKKAKDDVEIQEKICEQIISFLGPYKDPLNLDWLR